MRIALFAETFRENTGGMTRAVIQLHDGLRARGHDVRVFTLCQRSGPLHPGEVTFVPAVWLPAMSGLPADRWLAYDYPFVLGQLRGWASAGRDTPGKPDPRGVVVHLQTPFPLSWLGRRAAHRLGLPVVATCHANVVGGAQAFISHALDRALAAAIRTLGVQRFSQSAIPQPTVSQPGISHPAIRQPTQRAAALIAGLLGRAEIAFYNQMDCVVAPSRTAASQLIGRGLRRPVAVISNGVDVRRFSPGERMANPCPTALYAGRLSVEKGMDDLFVAIQHLLSSHPQVRFLVAGDGPYRSRLATLAAKHPGVLLLGQLPWEQMPEVYRQADVLVFPSPVETEGLVVLEAMACGLPVIGVRSGAVPDLVQDGINGFLVSLPSSRLLSSASHSGPQVATEGVGLALSELTWRVLADPALQARLAIQARQTALAHSIERSLDQLEAVYAQFEGPQPHRN